MVQYEEHNQQKKRFHVLDMQYLSFLLSKILSKGCCEAKIFFARPWPFNCEESIAIAIFGKCLFQVFSFAFLSLSYFPFQKQWLEK